MTKFDPNIYHRHSIRFPDNDYSNQGVYAVTLCAYNRIPLFGEIDNGVNKLNDIGEIISQYWQEIPNHFPSVELGEMIIMPNHLHGTIIILDKTMDKKKGTTCCAPTESNSQPANHSEAFGKPVSRSLPTIIRSYKAAVSKSINLLNIEIGSPLWQRGYYEHIIRNREVYINWLKYIRSNPDRWENKIS